MQVEITHDISHVQKLVGHASDAACQLLDSVPVAVKAYKLLNPVTQWYDRPLGDVEKQIGPINNAFFRWQTPTLLPDLSVLKAGVLKLRVIVIFNSSAKQLMLDRVSAWVIGRCRTNVPPVERLQKPVETPLDESEKISITKTMFEGLILCCACSVDGARTLFKIGDFNPDYVAIYCAVFDPVPDDRGTDYSLGFFWTLIFRLALTHPDFVFLSNHICPFYGEETVRGSDRQANIGV